MIKYPVWTIVNLFWFCWFLHLTRPFVGNGCSHFLNQPHGTFSSPNFPENYKNNVLYSWTIESLKQKTKNISIQFEFFKVEEDTNCEYDSVRIYATDVGQTEWKPVNKNRKGYCGSHKMIQIWSYSERLLVVFKTDGSVTRKGFSATYTVRDKTGNCYSSYFLSVFFFFFSFFWLVR